MGMAEKSSSHLTGQICGDFCSNKSDRKLVKYTYWKFPIITITITTEYLTKK